MKNAMVIDHAIIVVVIKLVLMLQFIENSKEI